MKYVYIVGVFCVNFLTNLLTRVQISLLVSLYGCFHPVHCHT